jgi:hypothetical protein
MDEPHVFCEGSDGEFRPLVVELFAGEPCREQEAQCVDFLKQAVIQNA